MRYIISPHPQGTAEWKSDRAGKATGSCAKNIVAQGKTKGSEAVARRDYRFQLAAEMLTGTPQEDGYVSKEMQWGTATEPHARVAYEARTGEPVTEAGFAYWPDLPVGCSVDGFLDGDGFLEIKCPKTATHVNYLLAARLPPEYAPQVTHNMLVTEAKFCDFVSFDPRLPEALQFFHVRVMRNELDLAGYEAQLMQFLKEVDVLERQLRARMPMAVAA